MQVEDCPYYEKYLKQGRRCIVCSGEIAFDEYCVINTPDGVRVIHRGCLGNLPVAGCRARIEVLYKSDK